MFKKIKRFSLMALVILLAISFFNDRRSWQSLVQPSYFAKAGNITNPAWVLSNNATSATGVTYTHTFTTSTAIPAYSGRVEISLQLPPGSQPPMFGSPVVAAGSTAALVGQKVEIFPTGCCGLSIGIQNGSTAIPAGQITLVITGVTNPAIGGVLPTNTVTSSMGIELDGRRGPDSNGSIKIGQQVLSGKITDAATGQGIKGFPVEVHGQFGGGFWQTKTDVNGNYSFFGIPAGTYVFEMSPGIDPGSSDASTISQYLRFEPMNITIDPANPQVVNKAVTKSSKIITGKVKYSDTGAVVFGANVNAFAMGPGGFAFTQTDANGNFTLRTGKGNFFVQVMPAFGPPPGQGGPGPLPAQDFFPQAPKQISFVLDGATAETINMGDILVDRSDATVTGKLVTPDGAPITGGGMGAMNFRTHQMIPVFLNQDGSFSFNAKSETGEWELNRFDPNSQFAMPDTRFTIKKGANNLGTIKMVALDGTITVTAKRIDGGKDEGIPNVPVMVFNTKKPGPPFMGFTNSSGVAQIKVPKGFEGRVMAMPGGEGGPGKRGGEGVKGDVGPQATFKMFELALAQQPPSPSGGSDVNQLFPVTPPQIAKDGDSITLKFDKADKKVAIRTLDSAGNLVTDGGFVNARSASATKFEGFGGGFGGPTAGGQGTVYVTKGDFVFTVFFPPDSQYLGKPKTVSVGDNGAAVDLTVVKKTVTITGEVQDASNNNAVIKDASLDIKIGIFGDGGFSMGSYDPSTGRYAAKFAPDMKFNVGVAAGDPGMGISQGGYIPNISPKEFTGKDGETITHNVTLAKVDAVISGTIKDQDGKAMEGVTVFADPGLADIVGPEGPGGPGPGPGPGNGPEFGFSDVTNSEGKFSINVSANKYNLVVNARGRGLFMTNIIQVDIKSKETKNNIDIQLARADSTLEIEVNDQAGNDLKGSEVQIFNDKGTIAFASEVDAQGKAKISVPADTYTIKAGKDTPEQGKVEESAFKKVVTKKGETTSTTLGTATQSDALAKPVTQEVDSSSPAAISLNKGGSEEASLSIPSGVLKSSSSGEGSSGGSDSPIVTVTPMEAQAVATKVDTPIKGITVSATDSNGNSITSLSGQVTGKIAYKESDLPTGVTEDNLQVKSFNEDSGQWESVSNSAVDKNNNVVNFATTHFSDFAIVATSDTTAPSAPTSISATNMGTGGTIKLQWTNPTDSDLKGINIYRSATEGQLGDLAHSAVTGTSKEDTDLTNGTKYYYTLRSVDNAGNESTNTDQVSATPTKSTLPRTGENQSSSGLWVIALSVLALGAFVVLKMKYAKR